MQQICNKKVMRSVLLECIVVQSELSELYEHSVHQALPKRQQAVHEANMATSTGSDEDKIRIAPSLLLWDGCKNKLEEENKGYELIHIMYAQQHMQQPHPN